MILGYRFARKMRHEETGKTSGSSRCPIYLEMEWALLMSLWSISWWYESFGNGGKFIFLIVWERAHRALIYWLDGMKFVMALVKQNYLRRPAISTSRTTTTHFKQTNAFTSFLPRNNNKRIYFKNHTATMLTLKKNSLVLKSTYV
jgi:hypothetical protein